MTSQVIINVDRKLKERAMKKARRQGIPFSAVLKLAIEAFVKGQIEVGISENFNAKTRKEIEEAERDYAKGKNISPTFSTVAQMRAYLDN
jgi:antitoxin component of RelBE/YafQ-DinJ toxin-antitoxin module